MRTMGLTQGVLGAEFLPERVVSSHTLLQEMLTTKQLAAHSEVNVNQDKRSHQKKSLKASLSNLKRRRTMRMLIKSTRN